VSTVAGVMAGLQKQAPGLQYYDGAVLCAAATSTGQLASCPLKSTSNVYGLVSRGAQSMSGFFCSTQVSTINPTCVVVQLSYFNVGNAAAKSYAFLMGLAAVAFQSAIGQQSVNIITGGGSAQNDNLYGFYVFLEPYCLSLGLALPRSTSFSLHRSYPPSLLNPFRSLRITSQAVAHTTNPGWASHLPCEATTTISNMRQ
jgi:hypothetical protein